MSRVQNKLADIKQNREKITAIGNFCFIGYYGIMVITKTFGYASYDMLFRIAFVLALACLGIKILTTRYTMREFLL